MLCRRLIMKDKLKNYSFWISVTGAVLLLINNLGKIFGFSVNNEAVYSIVDGICGVLVVFGVLTMNKSKKTDTNQANTQANIKTSTDTSIDSSTKTSTDNIDANKATTKQTQVVANKTESKSTQNKDI